MQINITTEWEWYENTNVFRLFTHCLLHIKDTATKWCGKIIDAGAFVSSIARLSAETGLSVSAVRTALKKLKDTGYIKQQSNNKYTIYTVNDYKSYITTADCGQKIEKQQEDVKKVAKIEEKTDKVKKKNEYPEGKTESKKKVNECFEKLWKLYPSKRGKGQVKEAQKRKLAEIGYEEMQRAVQRYKQDLEKDTWRKPQNGSTFFNSGYVDYLDANYVKPEEKQSTGQVIQHNFTQRDYDWDDLEEQLLQKQLS